MGILETIDQSVRGGVDAVVDNPTFSVQDTVRGGIMAATGQYGQGAEEFRDDSKAAFNTVNRALDAPAQAVNQATQGTPLNNPVTDATEQGGELVYEQFVEYPGAVAYGTTTGSNLRYDPEDRMSDTDYSPGALDALELAFFGAPAGRVASGAARSASRGARAASRSDEAAVAASGAAAGGSSMGIFSALRRAVSGSDEAADAARASDDAVGTQTTLDSNFANRASRQAEDLTDAPRDVTRGGALGPLRRAASSRTNQAIVGGTFGIGALGLGASAVAGGSGGGTPSGADLPDGYRVAATLTASPGAVIVEKVSADGGSQGFWVVISKDGSTYKALGLRGDGFGTMPVSFPTSGQGPFDSQSQARDAFQTWSRRVSNNEGVPTGPTDTRDDPAQSQWAAAEVVQPMNYGWYLVQQSHRTEQKVRFLVAGRDASGNLLFVGSGGTETSSPQTFQTRDAAMSAYETWVSSTSNPDSSGADPAQDRPTSSDLSTALLNSGPFGSGGGSSLGLVGMLAAGGAAAVIALIVYRKVIQ